jgi:two-component system NarL family response regulator
MGSEAATLGVLIVEDDPVFSYVLRLFLEAEAGVHVVDNVGTAIEALAHPSLGSADIVLIDIGLPGLDGIAATKQLLELDPALRIVVMSGSGYDTAARSAIAAGAADYVEKGALHETLVATLFAAARPARLRPAA